MGLLLLSLSPVQSGCSTQANLRGGDAALTDADLALGAARENLRSSGGFNETVRIVGQLDGGGSIYGRLIITNLATANQLARLTMSVAPEGKPPAKVTLRRKKGRWKARGDQMAFEMPPRNASSSSIVGRIGEVVWTGERQGAHIELRVGTTMAPVELPGGTADFGAGKFFKTTLVVPHGRLSTKVTIAGEQGQEPTSYTVEGWAFVEKRTSNLAPYAMAKRFVDVREINAEGLFALSGFQRSPQYGGKTQGWLFSARPGQASVAIKRLGLRTQSAERHDPSGYNVPRLVHFWDMDNPSIKGVVKANRSSRVSDDLGSLSKLERAIAERFARPWTFRFDAQWALRTADGRKLSGGGYYSYNQLN